MKARAILFAALPGLLLILGTRVPLVHHPANHYLIPVLPFLAAAAGANLAATPKLLGYLAHRSAWLVLALPAMLFTILHHNGVMDLVTITAASPRTAELRSDIAAWRAQRPLAPEESLIVDGNLLALFADHPKTTVLLGYRGNPRKLNAEELGQAHVVVTTADLRKVDDCTKVGVGGATMQVDRDYFVAICNRVRTGSELMAELPASGVWIFALKADATAR